MINCDKTYDKNIPCSVERILSLLSSKWTIFILRDLCSGTKRFGQLRKSLQGISPKTLSQRLRALEKEGMVSKKIYPEIPPRVEYSLTSRGESLKNILLPLIEWAAEYNGEDDNKIT